MLQHHALESQVRPAEIMLATCGIRVPGTKTAASAAVIHVDPTLWPWAVAAVPAPVGYKWLRLYWKRALKAAGADVTLRLHDLRHASGQWLVNDGAPESSVRVSLRHASPAMTRKYVTQRDRGESARRMADILGNSPVTRFATRSPTASTSR